ncbi:MAG: hypothetical protein EKK57_03090 [Proteobacteria bacterium]|nr:MAG: hypothetical protein EKK57_03090 [Pseudomonadota bacterium]
MSNCIQSVTHSQIKCEEKQSKFILLNPERKLVDYITIDGCMYPRGHHELCCDYALNFDDTTVFVELKGSDIAHAIKQVLATKQDAKFSINTNKSAVIVTSKMPKDDSSLRQQKINLKKQNIKLMAGNSPLTKNFADFE